MGYQQQVLIAQSRFGLDIYSLPAKISFLQRSVTPSQAQGSFPLLRAVYESLLRENYEEAFELSAKALPKRKKSAYYQDLLYGASCALLGLGHIRQAEQRLKQYPYQKLLERQPRFYYIKAYLALHHKQSAEALLYWTSILDLDPAQSLADHLIARLKKSEDELLEEIKTAPFLRRYVPLELKHLAFALERKAQGFAFAGAGQRNIWQNRLQRPFLLRPVFLIAALLLLSFFLFLYLFGKKEGLLVFPMQLGKALFFTYNRLSLPPPPQNGSVLLPEQYKEKPRFVYPTRQKVIALYKEASYLIQRGLVNQARAILGRLELSNISFELKERVLLLRSSIPFVAARELQDSPSLEAIEQEPYLYRNAQIYWPVQILSYRASSEQIEIEALHRKHSARLRKLSKAQGAPAQAYRNLLIVYPLPKGAKANKNKTLRELEKKEELEVFGIFHSLDEKSIKISARELFF